MECVEDEDDDIWDDKSLKQLKRKHKSPVRKRTTNEAKRNKLAKNSKSRSRRTLQTSPMNQGNSKPSKETVEDSGSQQKGKHKRKRSGSSNDNFSPTASSTSPFSNDKKTPLKNSQSDVVVGYCPKCQMPFSALTGQSPRWHVSECLETKYSYVGDCPEGFNCKSRYSPHFKRFCHRLLAASRSCFPPEDKEEEESNGIVNVEEKVQLSRQLDFSDQMSSQPVERKGCEQEYKLSSSSSDEENGNFQPLIAGDDSADASASPAEIKPGRPIDTNTELCHRGKHEGGCNVNKGCGGNESESNRGSNTFQSKCMDTKDNENIDIMETRIGKSWSSSGCYVKNTSNENIRFSSSSLEQQSHQVTKIKEPSSFALNTREPSTSVKREDTYSLAERFSDDDLFGDAQKFENLCESCDALCKETQDQEPDDSRGGVDFTSEDLRSLLQTVNSSKEETCGIGEEQDMIPCVDVGEVQCDEPRARDQLHLHSTKTQHNGTGESPSLLDLHSTKTQPNGTGESSSLLDLHSTKAHHNGMGESSSLLELQSTKTQDEIGESSSVKSAKGQKQLSLTSFFKKSDNSQAIGNKPSLRQADIGVFFGLKPLKTPAEEKLTLQPSNAKQASSSQVIPESLRNKGGIGKRKYPPKNLSHNSEGESSGQGDGSAANAPAKRNCPFYKKMPGCPITVDAFRYGNIAGCRAYFLSHFHYDHYGGLTGKFTNPIYCSKITANLVMSKLYVKEQYVHPLPMNTPVIVEGVQVTLLEANHCPGAVLFLFKFSNGQTYLHTGDFRASTAMEQYPELQQCRIDVLYLDTTYCDPGYSFPPQEETVSFAVSKAVEACSQNPKTLIVCGSYTIGKERVFLSIAEALKCKVCVQKDKKRILDCLESDRIKSITTTDWKVGKVHVLPMAKITLQNLESHLQSHQALFTELLAFKPTGWTHSAKREDLNMIKPYKRGQVTIYGVPYSEHSSFSELERFVKFVRPLKIIPTVNIHSADKRAQMQAFFNTWLA